MHLSPASFEILLFFISILVGIFGAILGVGGGIIIVPVLTLGFGINIRYAIGASIISVIATSSGAAAKFVRDRMTNVRVAVLLEVATTVGGLTGAIISTHIKSNYLFILFSLMLFYSALMMFRKKKNLVVPLANADYWSQKFRLDSSYPDGALGKEVSYAVRNVPTGFLLMSGAGIISGLLGVGSGVLKVPAMDTAMKLPIKVSSATSNFMIGVTAAASAGAYYMRNDIVPMLVAPVALGVLMGSFLGTHIMMKMKAEKIRNIFMIVLIIIAAQMALRGFGVSLR